VVLNAELHESLMRKSSDETKPILERVIRGGIYVEVEGVVINTEATRFEDCAEVRESLKTISQRQRPGERSVGHVLGHGVTRRR